MKLATLKDDTRDGRLVVVTSDLTRAIAVPHVARTMQDALDRWEQVEGRLRSVALDLQANPAQSGAFDFRVEQACAPLPRAFAWLDGSSYLSHLELFRKVAGRTVPEEYYRVPLMYQGGSDVMLNCRADLACAPDWGADCEAEVVVVTGDVQARPSRQQALDAIRLVSIANDVSLRSLQPRERDTGFGWIHCKPPTAFAPVMVTPDELGEAWRDGKLHLPLHIRVNDDLLGRPHAGIGMQFDFAQLIQHGAATRPLSAGTIVGSGTVSNANADQVGVACIAERRFIEQIRDGKPTTPYLQDGDVVRIDMADDRGQSIFGDIVQIARQVVQ